AAVCLALLGAAPSDLVGTWNRGDPEKGGGQLLTRQTADVVQFQLECWRGAPSYNSGFLDGEFPVSKGKGVFRSRAGPCELEFRFSANEVAIQYVSDSRDCGFGYAVYANGVYRRTSRKVPQFSKGDPRERP